MEAEKSYHPLSVSWSPRKASGIGLVQAQGLKIRRADNSLSLRLSAGENQHPTYIHYYV